MRVLIAFDWFWNYVGPQAASLVGAGADVALLCRTHADEFDGDQAERHRFIERARREGIEVFEVPGRFGSVSALPEVLRLRRAIRRWRPDVVHAHDNYDPRLLLLVRGYPLVLTVHDPTPHQGTAALTGARARIRRAWLRKADRLVVHGGELRAQLAALEPAASIAILPHGADVRAEPVEVPRERALLLFGRRERYKGLAVLLDAMQRVWRERPEVRLIVAGRGSDAGHLLADSRIEVRAEYIPEGELDALFARATLVVLPYIDASQSGVAMLALGRGIPVVATDVGAIPEVVPSSEFLAPVGDSDALAVRVLRWLDHGAALREQILEHARLQLSWSVAAVKALALYESVVGVRR
jgi:glycosyltransferase involved in cell wall biosynthesis